MSAFAAAIDIRAQLEALHIRNGIIIGRRYSAPRTPQLFRADPGLAHSVLGDMFNDGMRWARRLLHLSPHMLVTTAGVDYMASAFNGGSAISNFNFHDSGTGKESGGTSTLSGGSITNATPQVVTTPSAHGLTTSDLTTIAGVTTDTSANADWEITVGSPTTFTLLGSTAGGVAGVGSATYQRLNGAGDTALVTASGLARVSGTQSNPTANQYKSVATVTYTSSLAIVEWGLFSASSSGTLWDRRWFNTAGAPATQAAAALTAAPINVNNGDSIQFTYTLTINAGGS
jgi:hypothetical protein